MTETIAAWRDYLPEFLPLPHPSWRTLSWAKRHPWFERDVVPELRRRVRALLGPAVSEPSPLAGEGRLGGRATTPTPVRGAVGLQQSREFCAQLRAPPTRRFASTSPARGEVIWYAYAH